MYQVELHWDELLALAELCEPTGKRGKPPNGALFARLKVDRYKLADKLVKAPFVKPPPSEGGEP